MIIARAPLRITLGGGGTDLPSYAREHGGFCLAAAIDRYVYVSLHRTFDGRILLKYSTVENVGKIEEIKHPLIREALRFVAPADVHLEISSMADIPAGTGLGSSSSFACALLRALYAWDRKTISPLAVADVACALEIGKLREPIGKQDQHIAAYGGIKGMEFERDGTVKVWDALLSAEVTAALEEHLLLFFTGYSRSAGKILQMQNAETLAGNSGMIENLHETKAAGWRSLEALRAGHLMDFADLLHRQYTIKFERSRDPYAPTIDEIYRLGLRNGARSGKLIGAGGGGFLMFWAQDRVKLRMAMHARGLQEIPWRFDWAGTTLLTL